MSDPRSKRITVLRWIDVLLYSLAGSFFASYFSPSLSSIVSSGVERVFGSNLPMPLLAVYGIILLSLLVVIHTAIRFKLRHFKHAISYPPIALSVVFGSLASGLWPILEQSSVVTIREEDGLMSIILAASYVVFFVALGGAQTMWKGSVYDLPESDAKEGSLETEEGVPWGKYESWLTDDRPVADAANDWFGHSEIAHACCKRLKDGHSIALHGPYGAGKTSICRMVEAELSKSTGRIIFVTVSCWGFESSSSAQHHILDAVLYALSAEVDCLSFQDIPKHYIDAVADHSKPAASLLRVFQATKKPEDQLFGFDLILKAICSRLVLVIEDLDRSGDKFDKGDVIALLSRLRKMESISVVLAMAPDQQLDFLKVCDHFEPVPAMPASDVAKQLRDYRDLLLNHFQPYYIPDDLEPLEIDDQQMAQYGGSAGYQPLVTVLTRVIVTPRQLKVILRAVRTQWEDLCGEVRIDDLIVINTLRHIEPDAFYFLTRNQSRFKSVTASPSPLAHQHQDARAKVMLKEMKREWGNLVVRMTSEPRSVQKLIQYLDKGSGPIFGDNAIGSVAKQSIGQKPRSYVYARRLFSGRMCSGDFSDQKMLKLVDDAKQSPEGIMALANAIAFDGDASSSYLEFYKEFKFKCHFELISSVYEVLRERFASHEPNESDVPGFRAATHAFQYEVPVEVNDWLKVEVEKCIPSSLWLMTDIFNNWCSASSNRHCVINATPVPIQSWPIRKVICDRLRESWSESSATQIAECFDGAAAYTLFHIIYTTDFETYHQELMNASSDWAWMKTYLWQAAQARPEVMLPQLALLLMKDDVRRASSYSYGLDEDRFDCFIAGSLSEFYELVVEHCNPDSVANASNRLTLIGVVRYCREQLDLANVTNC